MPYTVQISDQPYLIDATTLTVDKTIGKTSSASFTLHTSDTTTHFQQYQQVAIYDESSALAFSGYLNIPLKETKPGYQASLEHQLTCIGQEWLAKKRVVAASFLNEAASTIVQWLVDNILTDEGVTVGTISTADATLIPSTIFGYCTVADALDALVTRSNTAGTPYYWAIDQNKALSFAPYTEVTGAAIDGTTFDDGHLSGSAPYVQRQNPLYRNTQYETGGFAQTATQTEVRVGDGQTQSWNMGYALASAPTISTNLNGAGYVAKTVGVQGVDTGKAFYWQSGSTTITQDSGGTVLRGPGSPVDLLKVVYVGQYPNISVASNPSQIDAQKALDGTSGIIEAVDVDATLTSATASLAKGSALLARYGVSGTVFVGQTRDASYQPGQLVTITLPAHGLHGVSAIIEEVSASDQNDGLTIWYTVTAVAGPYDTTWIDFFSSLISLATIAGNVNAGTTQNLTILAAVTAGLTLAASVTATIVPALIPSLTKYPSTTLYPG